LIEVYIYICTYGVILHLTLKSYYNKRKLEIKHNLSYLSIQAT